MAIFLDLVSLIALCIIFFSPFIILFGLTFVKLRYRFLIYCIIGINVLAVEAFMFSWWVNDSNMFLIEYYGYNWEGMDDVERYANVLPENLGEVKSLEMSLFGIGWPLKAFFLFVLFLLYIPIAYLIHLAVKKLRVKLRKD